MSMGWETTTDDVLTVLNGHKIEVTEERLDELHGLLDHDDIEEGVYYFDDINDQTDSMLSDIEDQLMEQGIIAGEKMFFDPEDDDDEDSSDIEDSDLEDWADEV